MSAKTQRWIVDARGTILSPPANLANGLLSVFQALESVRGWEVGRAELEDPGTEGRPFHFVFTTRGEPDVSEFKADLEGALTRVFGPGPALGAAPPRWLADVVVDVRQAKKKKKAPSLEPYAIVGLIAGGVYLYSRARSR